MSFCNRCRFVTGVGLQPALVSRHPVNAPHSATVPASTPKVFSTGYKLVKESIWSFVVIAKVIIILPMTQSFRNAGSEDIFDGLASSAARKCGFLVGLAARLGFVARHAQP